MDNINALYAAKSNNEEIAEKIDRLSEIKADIENKKQQADIIEAELLKIAQSDLSNTKYKSVKYFGTESVLRATLSENVKITLESLLPSIFGSVYKDMVKTTSKSELTAPAKRLIAGIWQGNFVSGVTVEDVVASMELDDKTAMLVSKKCRGINYSKDIDNLVSITGFSEQKAEEYAYMLMEAAIWQQFRTICDVNGIATEEALDELMKKIQAAFVVELTPKISVSEG